MKKFKVECVVSETANEGATAEKIADIVKQEIETNTQDVEVMVSDITVTEIVDEPDTSGEVKPE